MKTRAPLAKKLRQKTLEIHGGGSLGDMELRPGLSRVIAFSLGSFGRAKRLFEGKEEGFIYTRINNPTVDKLEKRLASLEGAEAGLAASSGMSAIALLAMHLCEHGGHLVASNRLYGGVFHLFRDRLPALGISVTFVENPHDPKEWESALRPNTRLIFLETPSNPLIEVIDLAPIVNIAKKRRIPVAVDSTLATPVLRRPLSEGADIVVHSLSKYFGDGEVIGGVILGKKSLMDSVRAGWMRDTGPCISPDNAAILCYHAESLFGRVKEHCANAERVAHFLARHKKVLKVFYPSLGKNTAKNRALMPAGFGGLMAFEVRGGQESAKTVLENLALFWHAANIGEARSLVIHPATTTHGQMTENELRLAGITRGTLRLSIGREDPDDLIEDLARALAKI